MLNGIKLELKVNRIEIFPIIFDEFIWIIEKGCFVLPAILLTTGHNACIFIKFDLFTEINDDKSIFPINAFLQSILLEDGFNSKKKPLIVAMRIYIVLKENETSLRLLSTHKNRM